MNTQELINKIGRLYTYGSKNFIERKEVIDLVKQLDEPQKPVVKQFVADWYEENKDDFETNLFNTIGLVIRDFEDGDLSAFEEWILDKHKAPFQTLVNMHQFGYEVEKEKRYYVRFKFIEDSYSYLTLIKHLNAWTLTEIKTDKKFRTEHTKKQLEEAGFGWVFDCEGIELEEVE